MVMFLHSLFLKMQEANILLRNGYKSEESSIKSNNESLTTPYITGKRRGKDTGNTQGHFPRALPHTPALGHALILSVFLFHRLLWGLVLIFPILGSCCPQYVL